MRSNVFAASASFTDASLQKTLIAQDMAGGHCGNAVALLCAKEAGWITGQVVAVDGGASLMSPALPLAIQQPELATA